MLDASGAAEVDTVDQMTQHPATYYVLAAGVLHLVDFEAHRPAVDVLALRLFSALFVLPLPALAWATVRRVTRSPRAAVVGAFAVLAVPELASIGASVSNDPPVMLFGATTVWLAVRVLTGDARTRTAFALALSLGVAILWKGTALPLIPFVAVAAALSVGASGGGSCSGDCCGRSGSWPSPRRSARGGGSGTCSSSTRCSRTASRRCVRRSRSPPGPVPTP